MRTRICDNWKWSGAYDILNVFMKTEGKRIKGAFMEIMLKIRPGEEPRRIIRNGPAALEELAEEFAAELPYTVMLAKVNEKYEELMTTMDPYLTSYEKLLYLNRELFSMIENGVSLDLLARLYSSQLITRAEKHLLDRNRTYYRILRKIIAEGQQNGEFLPAFSVNEIEKAYAMCERALIYDWCLCGGEYSLRKYSSQILPLFLAGFRANEK